MPIKISQIERRAEFNARQRIRADAYNMRESLRGRLAELNSILNVAKGLRDLNKRDKKDLAILEEAKYRLREKLRSLYPENVSPKDWSRIYREELRKLLLEFFLTGYSNPDR